jgi:hypothetical protein
MKIIELINIMEEEKLCFACASETHIITSPFTTSIQDTLRHHNMNMYAHWNDTNKTISVAIIIRNKYRISNIHKDSEGRLIGINVKLGKQNMLIMSGLFPPNLDRTRDKTIQNEAMQIYDLAKQWTKGTDLWLLAADNNETRRKCDRITLDKSNKWSEQGNTNSMLVQFENETKARDLYSSIRNAPAYTRGDKHSEAVLDHITISQQLFDLCTERECTVIDDADEIISDHKRIHFTLTGNIGHTPTQQPAHTQPPRPG